MSVLKDARIFSIQSGINIAFGTIVRDDKGRFNPDEEIRTSVVIDFGIDFIQTLNTRYEIESWRDGKSKENKE